MAGEFTTMYPLKHLGSGRLRDKLKARGTSSWIRLSAESFLDTGLNLPGDRGNNAGGRKNCTWFDRDLLLAELARQGIRFYVAGTRAIGKSKVKPAEEKGPPRLPGI